MIARKRVVLFLRYGLVKINFVYAKFQTMLKYLKVKNSKKYVT